MFKNYLVSTYRALTRQFGYTIINILGLALGLACCTIIMLYVKFELSYDRYHDNSESIYRVMVHLDESLKFGQEYAMLPDELSALLPEEIPEVIEACPLKIKPVSLKYNNERFTQKIAYSDSSFFDIFSVRIISGDAAKALNKPYSAVVTESAAKQMFDDADPIGQSLRVGTVFDITIQAVIEDPPENSHFHYDLLLSRATHIDHFGSATTGGSMTIGFDGGGRIRLSTFCYIKLTDGILQKYVEEKLNNLAENHFSAKGDFSFYLMPLTDIHLNGNTEYELEVNGNFETIYFLGSIALLILIIACFNYMNLSTAQAAKRAREVGMRKILGASRFRLVYQYLGESLLLTAVSMILALVLIVFMLPSFNDLVGRNLYFNIFSDKVLMAALILITLTVDLFSGTYPALFLSGFKPLSVIRNSIFGNSFSSSAFRNILVIFQFVISIALIIGTITVHKQLDFAINGDLGYTNKNVITFRPRSWKMVSQFQTIKKELIDQPGVLDITGSSEFPSTIGAGASRCWWEGQKENYNPFFARIEVDYNFFEFYGIDLIEGRLFSPEFKSDKKQSYVLNETAIKIMGIKNPIGKKFGLSPKSSGTIIGVVRDFNFASVHEEKIPLAIKLNPTKLGAISIKYHPDNLSATTASLDDFWRTKTGSAFNYNFLDERIDKMYKDEQNLGKAFMYFASLAVFIALLGLLGLASYNAERRTKEIGIRKIMGASVSRIVLFLTRQFTKWVIIANFIAWPIAWYAMNRWLSDFAYRIELKYDIFLMAGGFILICSVLTVIFKAIRAGNQNPIETIRHE